MQNGKLRILWKSMYMQWFMSDLVMFIEIVSNIMAFVNPCLVKSVNLTFTHVLYRSVYHDFAFTM